MTIEEAMFILQHGSSEGEQKYLLAARNVGHYIKQLCEENAELKRLLRLAVDALKKVSEENHSYCLSDGICDECDFTAEGNKNWCEWKHAEEAMKILEDNNG